MPERPGHSDRAFLLSGRGLGSLDSFGLSCGFGGVLSIRRSTSSSLGSFSIMRRPIPLKKTGLKAAEYKLIGEIVVLSGMIEDTLKRMPLAMLRVDIVPGIAFTAHLKASSICDMVSAILPYFLADHDLTTEVEEMVRLARSAGDIRNDIVHGPFWSPSDLEHKGTRKFTARSNLKFAMRAYDEASLRDALALHIKTWEAVADCYVGMCALAEERERLGLSPLRQDFAQRANCQTDDEPQ